MVYRKWARCGPHIHHIEAADASNCCHITYLPRILATSNATDDPEIKEITTIDHPHARRTGTSTSSTPPLMRRRAKRSSASRRCSAADALAKLADRHASIA